MERRLAPHDAIHSQNRVEPTQADSTRRLDKVALPALYVGTVVLLGGSVFIGAAVTDQSGALWLPAGFIASIIYLYGWGSAMRHLAVH